MCVRGSIVIKGYLNRPEANAETIKDGWLNTGDIARIDDEGFVYIVDRAKDMVIRGGENVYCSEVETVIYNHDAIAEAAVFGIPEERLGEEVERLAGREPGETVPAKLPPLEVEFIRGGEPPGRQRIRIVHRDAAAHFISPTGLAYVANIGHIGAAIRVTPGIAFSCENALLDGPAGAAAPGAVVQGVVALGGVARHALGIEDGLAIFGLSRR